MLPERVGWALQLIEMKRKGWSINVEEEIKKASNVVDLNEYSRRVQAANEKWWLDIDTGLPKERNVAEMLMLTVTELAEACEGHRKNKMDDKLPQYRNFDVEVVDCIIRCLDLARIFKNPILEIFEAKMAFNAVREDHTLEHRRSAEGKKY